MDKETFELIKEIAKDPKRIGFVNDTGQKFFVIEPVFFNQMIDELEKLFNE